MTPRDLEQRRAALGLSQSEFGRALGVLLVPPRVVPVETVSRWETGARPIAEWVPLALERLERG